MKRFLFYLAAIAMILFIAMSDYSPLELIQQHLELEKIRQHLEQVDMQHEIDRHFFGEERAMQMELQRAFREIFPEKENGKTEK